MSEPEPIILTAQERRKSYNKEWWAKNKHRRQTYNRSCLEAGKSKFETGEKQRATEGHCSLCKQIKPATEFYLSNTNANGLHGWCKSCSDRRAVENGRKRLFGVSPEAFAAMLKAQGGCCAICKSPEDQSKKAFCIDHDHQTGAVRGILCTQCNSLLGMAKDKISTLHEAIHYLERANF